MCVSMHIMCLFMSMCVQACGVFLEMWLNEYPTIKINMLIWMKEKKNAPALASEFPLTLDPTPPFPINKQNLHTYP